MALNFCMTALLPVFFSLLAHTVNGQDLIFEENPVREGGVFKGNCTRPSGSGSISVNVVGGDPGRLTQTAVSLTLTVFTYSDVTPGDNGITINCFDQLNATTVIILASIQLEVEFAPRYTGGIFDEVVYAGSPFSRTLTLDSNPGVGDNFNWTKDGAPFNGNVNATSIYIPETNLNDAGIYTVTAGNILNTTTASFILNVTCAPEFLNGTNTTVGITFDEGDNLVIFCDISQRCPLPTNITLNVTGSGNPMNGQTFQLPADSRKIFSNALLSFSGNYICIADNGIAISTLEYRAEAIPSPTGSSPSSSSSGSPSGTPTTPAPSTIPAVIPVGTIIGAVLGILAAVLVCAFIILIPVLCCCCFGCGIFATLGCACASKKNDKADLKVEHKTEMESVGVDM